jgi:hypothetical protein
MYEQLKTIKRAGNCPELINHVLSIDLHNMGTRLDRIHRLPWCEVCFPGGIETGVDSFEIPWRV